MAMVTREELVERAEALGHTDLRIYPSKSGRRFVLQCSCGFGAPLADGRPTVTCATFKEAVTRLQNHLWRELEKDRQERVRNGRVSPSAIARQVI